MTKSAQYVRLMTPVQSLELRPCGTRLGGFTENNGGAGVRYAGCEHKTMDAAGALLSGIQRKAGRTQVNQPSWSARSVPLPSRFWATNSQLIALSSTVLR
jgi:hypothetical protein